MMTSRGWSGASRLPLHAALFLVAAVLIAFAGVRLGTGGAAGAGFVMADVPKGGAPSFEADIVTRASSGIVHAPSIVEAGPGELLAVWYQGSREGARDVAIHSARHTAGGWEAPAIVASAQMTARDLHRAIRTVGNPVLLRRAPGEIWLIYVTTSVGGWSTSALNLKRSFDGGRSWDAARRLVTTPFFNISTLVKAPPFVLADGFAAVPAYEEMAAKLPELLVLDKAGSVVDRRRMGGTGKIAIQPFVVALDRANALALMRPDKARGRHVFLSRTADGGGTWSPVAATVLPNPYGPVAVLRLSGGLLLLVFNNDPGEERDMTLAVSRDGGAAWLPIAVLDETAPGEPASLTYPSATVDSAGTIHVVYVDRRDETIRHIAFNRAWVEARAAR